ncbi:hypothetical protein [Ideonella sp. YS5]|uniref:hypothetical protein n=1 Tax=Ideonella sp. YS5 TaxID=3453714 RepID=UPI003EEC68A1
MAIWQFDLAFYPRGGPEPWRVDDGHEVPPLQEGQAAKVQAWLLRHFGEPSLLLEGWLIFGMDQGNRIDLVFNEDRTANLSARIDARSNYESFVSALCELGRFCNCVLFSAEFWATIEPATTEVHSALHHSRAIAFVNNPHAVLRASNPGG